MEENLRKGHLGLPDSRSEFPGALPVGGEGAEVVQSGGQDSFPRGLDDVVFVGIARSPVEREMGFAEVTTGEFVLAKLEEEVELRVDGVGSGVSLHPVYGISRLIVGMLLGQATPVIGGRDSETAFNPTF